MIARRPTSAAALAAVILVTGACSSDPPKARRAVAEATFPLPTGRVLVATTRPEAARLLVRQLAAQLVDLEGVDAVDANYETGTVTVLLTSRAESSAVDQIRQRLITSPAIATLR